jgi:DNA modification methylase
VTATLHCGDVRQVLAGLPEQSVQCVVTSPPYWGLRDYGTAQWDGGTAGCDHRIWGHAPDKPTPGGRGGTMPKQEVVQREGCRKCGARRVDNQLGLERTPEEYVANMAAVFREVRRVLRDDGVLWLNLGDSYASGEIGRHDGYNPTRANGTGTNKPFGPRQQRRLDTGLKPKDLVGIPWMVAFALRSDGWYLRSDVIWAKPNPMPESVTDRPTKAHEYLFLLTKSEQYYYDAAAIAEPVTESSIARVSQNDGNPNWNGDRQRNYPGNEQTLDINRMVRADGTRNARTVWTIATQPYAGAHFATFPEELARRCILAGSAAKACESCGAPWERVLEREGKGPEFSPLAIAESGALPDGPGIHRNMGGRYQKWLDENPKQHTGNRPTCACEANTGAAQSTVLDPFGGSGTTAAVATGHGRRAIYIDLNPAYLDLAEQRIGPMLCARAQPEKDAA